MIKEIIVTRIRPFVQDDGGDVTLVEFDEKEGIVWLQMKGSCAGCPSATVTLKSGIEKMMKHYVPGVIQVCEVENESDEEDPSPFREGEHRVADGARQGCHDQVPGLLLQGDAN